MNDGLTLAAAAALDPSQWEGLSVIELDFDDATRERTSDLWLWLCGVDPFDPDADRVRREVLGDGGLVVALNLPAVEFFRWFRQADLEHFDSTARTQSEAWAWAALQRAWCVCDGLGGMASQVALRVPCVLTPNPGPLAATNHAGSRQ